MLRHVGGIAIVLNPDKIDRRRLERALGIAGWTPSMLLSCRWIETDYESRGAKAIGVWLASEASADFDTMVIAGGDGTVRIAIQALFDAKALGRFRLGVLPIGTGNILARNLRLPISLDQAAKRLVSPKEHRIDLGVARVTWAESAKAKVSSSSFVFSAIAGVGQDARLMQNTESSAKRRIGWVAYLEGGLKSLPLQFERFDLVVDSAISRTLKSYSILVGNAGWFPGLISMMPDAKLDDGLLDIAAIGPRRFWNWIGFFSRVTWQNLVVRPVRLGRWMLDASENKKTIENLNGRQIEIRPHHPALFQVDGDPQKEIVSADFSVLPKALRVLV